MKKLKGEIDYECLVADEKREDIVTNMLREKVKELRIYKTIVLVESAILITIAIFCTYLFATYNIEVEGESIETYETISVDGSFEQYNDNSSNNSRGE